MDTTTANSTPTGITSTTPTISSTNTSFQTPSVVTPMPSSVATTLPAQTVATPTTNIPTFTQQPTPSVPTAPVETALSTAQNFLNATNQPTQTQKTQDALLASYRQALGLDGTAGIAEQKATDTALMQQEAGIDAKTALVNSITAQILGNQATTNASKLAVGKAVGGITTGERAGFENEIERNSAIKNLNLSAQLYAAQGDLATANATIDRAIKAKYDPQEARLNAVKEYLTVNGEQLKAEDAKAYQKQQTLLAAAQKDLENKKAEEKDKQTLAMNVAKNGGNQAVVSAVSNAKTFNDAVVAAAPYMMSLADKADIAYKTAQTAKIYNEMRNDSSLTKAPSQTLAYAQQYASTGQIPAGLPKGTFGAVAQYAKELPKAQGTVVDNATGVKPSKLSADQEKGIAALYDIIHNNIPPLQESFNKINTGIVGGTLGGLVGSQERQDFETNRNEILNKLLLARSGAAVTEEEYNRYKNMIPTTFNQPLFLGTDGDKKINSFTSALRGSLDSTLSTNGVSIYGYSKIKTADGVERTVGDLIKSQNGQVGRINQDGTITLVQ